MLLSSFSLDPFEAGCDEVGRGCLAGPVFAAAVILPLDYQNAALNDSKKLTEKQRLKLREVIEKEAVAFAIATCTPAEIDEINILNASFLAMHRAIDRLNKTPGFLLIDGNRFKKYGTTPHQCIVKGDGKYLSIAAASILAKTYRDDFMMQLDREYPAYFWNKNKGYPTMQHKMAIQSHGLTPYHRLTFKSHIQLRLNI